jgi:CRISPR-associated endoribonuclease Cas6
VLRITREVKTMRFTCEYKTDKLPIGYQTLFLSLIKESFKKVNEDYYKKLYEYEGKHNKKTKPFCFGVFIKGYEIVGDCFNVHDSVILNISTADYELGINLYNGLLNLKEFKYKDFTLEKKRISLSRERFITEEKALFKSLSPIHIKNKENQPISPDDEGFETELNYIVNKTLESHRGYGLKKPLGFEKVSMKKIVVKEEIRDFIKQTNKSTLFVNAYSGIFKLSGDAEDLNHIYQMGIGFRRNQGFGMVDIIS